MRVSTRCAEKMIKTRKKILKKIFSQVKMINKQSKHNIPSPYPPHTPLTTETVPYTMNEWLWWIFLPLPTYSLITTTPFTVLVVWRKSLPKLWTSSLSSQQKSVSYHVHRRIVRKEPGTPAQKSRWSRDRLHEGRNHFWISTSPATGPLGYLLACRCWCRDTFLYLLLYTAEGEDASTLLFCVRAVRPRCTLRYWESREADELGLSVLSCTDLRSSETFTGKWPLCAFSSDGGRALMAQSGGSCHPNPQRIYSVLWTKNIFLV